LGDVGFSATGASSGVAVQVEGRGGARCGSFGREATFAAPLGLAKVGVDCLGRTIVTTFVLLVDGSTRAGGGITGSGGASSVAVTISPPDSSAGSAACTKWRRLVRLFADGRQPVAGRGAAGAGEAASVLVSATGTGMAEPSGSCTNRSGSDAHAEAAINPTPTAITLRATMPNPPSSFDTNRQADIQSNAVRPLQPCASPMLAPLLRAAALY
jgi:hypothetical protein